METKQAEMGDVVRLLEDDSFDITVGNLYYIYKTVNASSLFFDDVGNSRAFHIHSKYEIVGKLQDMVLPPPPPIPELKDIHGQTVVVGDYVAYTYSLGALKVFEVMRISPSGVAEGRCVIMNSLYPDLGVFNERAIKLKDYVQ